MTDIEGARLTALLRQAAAEMRTKSRPEPMELDPRYTVTTAGKTRVWGFFDDESERWYFAEDAPDWAVRDALNLPRKQPSGQ